MIRPKTLVQYPWVVVRIECALCPRRGLYRLARLAARYGPEQSLDGLLADLAHECPWWRTNPRQYEPQCGARFVDLVRNLPPPDVPDAPVYRQRQPDREDLPSAPTDPLPPKPGKLPMLSEGPEPAVIVMFDRCGRRDEFEVADLLRKGNPSLIELRLT